MVNGTSEKMINTSWDFWNTRCHERWKPGNFFDQLAVAALDEAIQEEFEFGLTNEFPQRSRYLLQEELKDVMNYSLQSKKFWLQSVEAARKYSIPRMEDEEETFYEPS